MAIDIVQVMLTVKLPPEKWVTELSEEFPNLTFQVLSMILLENGSGNTLIRIVGERAKEALSRHARRRSTPHITVLAKETHAVLLNVATAKPLILGALVEAMIPIMYPIVIRQGEAAIEIVGPRGKIDELLSTLEIRDIHFTIRRIGRYQSKPVLTGNQDRVLKAALERDYFEVPRGVTLNELAAELGVATSTLSETMRRVMKALAMNFLGSR
ncbi:MAG: helix-turn-helix domain-containing protein [Promethearchaeota archaeon]